MDSTVYRRGSDGAIVGTPENNVSEQPSPAISHTGIAAIPPGFAKMGNEQPETVYRAQQQAAPRRALKLRDLKPGKSKKATAQQVPVAPSTRMQKIRRSPIAKLIRRVFLGLRVVVAAYVLFYVGLGYWTSHALNKTDALSAHVVPDTAGTNWLLVGSDSRAGLSKAEQKSLKTGKDEGTQRTDTIMLVHLDESGKPTLVSFPRDSYVKIPAHKSSDGTKVGDAKNKINAAFSFGGASLLVRTVEANTGLHIDHYMEIGFLGIRDLTDAVNGVDMCVPRNYKDKNSGLNVKKGCQTMNGKTALAYVRMRYADPKGDIGRIERQQQFVGSLIHKAVQPSVFLNPFATKSLATAGVDSVVVSKHDGVIALGRLGMGMKNLSGGKGKVMTVPISNPDASTPVGSSVLWDEKKAAKLFRQLGAVS